MLDTQPLETGHPFPLKDYFMWVGFCPYVLLCAPHAGLVPLEARLGCQIPWN